MEGKLKAGASGYDLITPSDYMVKRLIQAGRLASIPKEDIPNLKHLNPRFQNMTYDPKGQYSVPYMWGSAGIAYNSAKLSRPPESWKDFFDPSFLQGLERRVSLLDDPREVLGAALKAEGASINSKDTTQLEAAKARLLATLPHLGRIDSNSYKDLLASGDLWLAHGYSGDVLRLQATHPDIKFIAPSEGSTYAIDNLVIPLSAPHKKEAALFIDFIMRPEINARIAQSIHFATTNDAAQRLLPPEMLRNPNIYPSDEAMARFEGFEDLGDRAQLYDAIWTEVKAAAGDVTIEEGQDAELDKTAVQKDLKE
jgi:spermidine/putrescine transport system substrate-binding protein